MRLVRMSIEGFRSFRTRQTMTFPKTPGFFMLSGSNEAEPELGANGSGKTSVWEALTWCLYGKTARKMRGPSVVSWGDDHAAVEVEFVLDDGSTAMISRQQNPNTLILKRGHLPATHHRDQTLRPAESNSVEQDVIDELLGMSYDEWLVTVMMGQFNSMFFDLSPADKLAIFSSVMDLDCWTAASAEAKKRMASTDAEERKLALELRGAESDLQSTERQLRDAKELSETWQADREKRVQALQKLRTSIEERLADAKVRLGQAEGKVRCAADAIADAERHIQRYSDRADERLAAAREADRVLAKAESALDAHRKRQARLGAGTCPTCGQSTAKVLREAQDEEPALQAAVDAAAEKAGLRNERHKAAKQKLEAEGEEVIRIRREQAAAERARNEAKRQVSDLERELSGIDRDMGRDDQDPHASTIQKAERRIADLKIQQGVLGSKIGRVRRHIEHLKYWVDEFKSVRYWLIKEALRQLDVEVNNACQQLGLDKWRVSFDVERETKAGNIAKGFHVMIEGPANPEPVPWESWSGGETQRLRIAGAIGFASLVRSRLGVELPLEVWDEPTAHLSGEGVTDLLDFFAARARLEERYLWIVDHRSLDRGQFDGEWRVTKREDDGSRIEKVRTRIRGP